MTRAPSNRPAPAFRRYIAGDAALITPRTVLAAEHAAVRDDFLHGGAIPPGRAWTMTWRGLPVACAGFSEVWEGRWIAWSFIGELPARLWPALTAETARLIAELRERYGARRIEANTPVDFVGGHAWLRRLGFEFEGIARAFGPDGSDYAVYAIAGGQGGR